MSEHVLFLLHGMGRHLREWSSDASEALRTGYETAEFQKLNALKFEQRFTIVELEYDSVFRDYVERWSTGAEAIEAASEEAGFPFKGMVSWLRSAREGNSNFRWTHAADVVMYRAFGSVRMAVKTHVAKAIVNELKAHPGKSWSIIAHSLGTAVAHDTLHSIWSGEQDQTTGFESHNRPAQAVIMVANVSRALQTNPKVYGDESRVMPGPASDKRRGCRMYVNVRHKYDPFTRVRPFQPDFWPNPNSVGREYFDVRPNHILGANVHDLVHYLKSPLVLAAMFRALLRPAVIPAREEEAALAGFAPFGQRSAADLAGIRGRLEGLAPGGQADWMDMPRIWERFNATL